MSPETATLAAVTRAEKSTATARTRGAFTPMESASSSDIVRTLRRQRMDMRPVRPIAMGAAASARSATLAPLNDPSSQNVMACSWLDGSATSLV